MIVGQLVVDTASIIQLQDQPAIQSNMIISNTNINSPRLYFPAPFGHTESGVQQRGGGEAAKDDGGVSTNSEIAPVGTNLL